MNTAKRRGLSGAAAATAEADGRQPQSAAADADAEEDSLWSALRAVGGLTLASLLRRGGAGDRSASRAALDAAHERLHTGDWRDVAPAWRDAYALAALQLLRAPGNSSCAERLRVADLGLLLGGDRFRPQLDAAADTLAEEVRGKRGRGADADAPHPPRLGSEPSAPVPLPPGAGAGGVPCLACPSLDCFARLCVVPGAPAVVTGVLEGWPALRLWPDPAHLLRLAGDRTVPVEVGEHYMAAGWAQRLTTLRTFLLDHLLSPQPGSPTAYLAQHALLDQVPALRADVMVPDYVCLGGGDLVAINVWLGPAGTLTPLHTDPHHNLLCQAVGRKHVRLYAPGAASAAALCPAPPPLGNTARVDFTRPDGAAFPLFSAAPFADVTLQPGDALYIPPGWWHGVLALTSSASVSFWW